MIITSNLMNKHAFFFSIHRHAAILVFASREKLYRNRAVSLYPFKFTNDRFSILQKLPITDSLGSACTVFDDHPILRLLLALLTTSLASLKYFLLS